MDNRNGFLAGVDEAGRGPLAGPVIAAAVVLGNRAIKGIGDSKKISEKNRESLFEEIKAKCVAYAVGSSSPVEIDCLNIHNATLARDETGNYGINSSSEISYGRWQIYSKSTIQDASFD